jgi:O-antigen/teichoic acid export membrane protein
MIILGMFLCLTPAVYYIGVGTLVSGLVGYMLRFIYKKCLFPNLRARLDNFSLSAIAELLSSGIWNSISSLGNVLINSLDLLVANLFVGATAMGTLSIAKTMPAFVSTLISTIASVFIPSLIMDYSQGSNENLVETIRQSSKLISIVCSLPLGFLIVYGKEFYGLWQPSQNVEILYELSVITIFGRVFFTGVEPLFNIFTVVNKVKENALVTVGNGLVSIVITYILVRYTSLGIYAIAGVSVACCFVKNMVFVIPYSAKYLGLKKTEFFYTVFYSISCCGILCIWGFVLKCIFHVYTWFGLILVGIIFATVGFMLTLLIVLEKGERTMFVRMIKGKVKR